MEVLIAPPTRHTGGLLLRADWARTGDARSRSVAHNASNPHGLAAQSVEIGAARARDSHYGYVVVRRLSP